MFHTQPDCDSTKFESNAFALADEIFSLSRKSRLFIILISYFVVIISIVFIFRISTTQATIEGNNICWFAQLAR